jgi:hypothetical protein
MGAATHSAVHDDVYSVADGINDFFQLIERRTLVFELPATVIGHDNAVAADVGGMLCVLGRHHSFRAD